MEVKITLPFLGAAEKSARQRINSHSHFPAFVQLTGNALFLAELSQKQPT